MILGRRTKQRIATLERNLEVAEDALRFNGFIPTQIVSTEVDSVGEVSHWRRSVQFMSERAVARDKELRGRVTEAEVAARRKALAAVLAVYNDPAYEIGDYEPGTNPSDKQWDTDLFWNDIQVVIQARKDEREAEAEDQATARVMSLVRVDGADVENPPVSIFSGGGDAA